MQPDILKDLVKEIDVIKRNLEEDSYLRNQPLGENGFKILKELNNHNSESGLRVYSREQHGTFHKYPDVMLQDIEEHLGIPNQEVIKEIKLLFHKRYVDFNIPITDKIKEYIASESGVDIDLLKYGTIYDTDFKEIKRYRLTDRGFAAMIDYSLGDLQRQKLELEELSLRNKEQLNELKEQDSKRSKEIQIMDGKMKETETAISKFNGNIFTIFSLMIAVFAVIGINVASIPNIKSNFISNIIAVNFSICFSLIVLFYLMNTLLYKEKNKSLLILLLVFSIAFIILVLTKMI